MFLISCQQVPVEQIKITASNFHIPQFLIANAMMKFAYADTVLCRVVNSHSFNHYSNAFCFMKQKMGVGF